MIEETESQVIVRRAKEALAYQMERQNQAIKELASIKEDVKRAREKYEILFTAEEERLYKANK